jgi:hypothetical protein
MKKILACVTVLVVLAVMSTSLHAISLFGNAGVAASDLRGLFFDFGVEFKLSHNFYGQVLVDYYWNTAEELSVYKDEPAIGCDLYVVYKFAGSRSVNFFVKAGVHQTTIEGAFDLFSSDEEVSRLGIGGGVGLEYLMSKSFALVVGATAKLIFLEEGTGNWFQFYSGLRIRL